nr:hypothetical protein [Tanacetum cinerariifolium]
VKENQKKDKIGSKPDKNEKRDEAEKSQKQLHDHTEEKRSGITTTHAYNSLPMYDSFCFEIEPDQERLTSVIKNDISDDSDIYFLKELLIDDSIPFPNNESYDFEDDPLFPRPPQEPSDVKFFFDSKPDVIGEVISAVMNYNDDECFDPVEEINIFVNDEDDDYFSFIFVI